MGTIRRFGRLRVVMLAGDHAPPHVHIFGPEGEVVVRLDNMAVLGSPAAIRGAAEPLSWIKNNLEHLLADWTEVNG